MEAASNGNESAKITPRFQLGQTVATPGALAALEQSGQSPAAFLRRHHRCDWGDVCAEDAKLNDEAIAHEGDLDQQSRVLSVYHTSDNTKLFCITEWDRSVTTLLLSDEY